MASDRTLLQIQRFEEALAKLHEALVLDETEIVRDALIQRFETTFEMAWKAAWRVLLDLGEKSPEAASQAIEAAFRVGLIEDAGLWQEVRKYRNLTSHSYQINVAVSVAAFVRASAIHAFDALLVKLKSGV